MVSSVVSVDGVEISFEVHGAGTPPLVLVHGWSCDRGYWDAQVRALALQFRVVAIDLAGHGASGADRDRWTIPAFGADVAAVVGVLDLDRAILVGHSMGGDVILEAARRLPERVEGLVWVDEHRQLASFRSPGEVAQRLQAFHANFVEATQALVRGMFAPGADPALVERVALDMSAAPRLVALEALESTWNFAREVPALLQALHCPVIAVNPAEPPSDGDSLQRHGVKLVSMPNVGHFPMMEDPNAFNRVLTGVVNELASPDADEGEASARRQPRRPS